jgi:hypothetical protein
VPFITFVDIDPPNSIDKDEARFLCDGLRQGQPSEDAQQTALKIQKAVDGGNSGIVSGLSASEKEAIVATLGEASSPGDTTSDRLRWIEQQFRRDLGDIDVH